MAQVFRIATKTQDLTYSFLTGWAIVPQSMTRTPNGDGWLTTSMTMVARAADATIIASAERIDSLAELCDLFWTDSHRTNSVWLEESATAETTKRSLISSIELLPIQVGKFSPLLGKTGALYTLTIIHNGVWEYTDIVPASVTDATVSVLGGLVTLPAITGSIPARIPLWWASNNSETTNWSAETIWAGIQHNLGGTTFNPLWELENGGLGVGVVIGSDSDNASPLGTTDNIITYACTTDEAPVVHITMDQVPIATTDAYEYHGDYMVLLRCKLSAAQSVRLRMDYGWEYGTAFIQGGKEQYISSTAWHLVEMGTISIPPIAHLPSDFDIFLDSFGIRIHALLIGTATTLSLDCIVLIPIEHFIKLDDLDMAINDIAYYFKYEDGIISAITHDSSATAIGVSAECTETDFSYPVEGGVMVFASEQATGQNLAATYNEAYIRTYYIPRYRVHGPTV